MPICSIPDKEPWKKRTKIQQIDKGWQLLISLNLKTENHIKKTNIQFHDINNNNTSLGGPNQNMFNKSIYFKVLF